MNGVRYIELLHAFFHFRKSLIRPFGIDLAKPGLGDPVMIYMAAIHRLTRIVNLSLYHFTVGTNLDILQATDFLHCSIQLRGRQEAQRLYGLYRRSRPIETRDASEEERKDT